MVKLLLISDSLSHSMQSGCNLNWQHCQKHTPMLLYPCLLDMVCSGFTHTKASFHIPILVFLFLLSSQKLLPVFSGKTDQIYSKSLLTKSDVSLCVYETYFRMWQTAAAHIFFFFTFIRKHRFLTHRKNRNSELHFEHAILWNERGAAAVMRDRNENVCREAKDFWWLTWNTDNNPNTSQVSEQWMFVVFYYSFQKYLHHRVPRARLIKIRNILK